MNKNTKKLLIGVSVGVGIVFLGASIYKLIKENNTENPGDKSPKKKPVAGNDTYAQKRKPCSAKRQANHPTTARPIADEFPLRLGSEGPRVERLQIYLMRNYGRTGIVNSVFSKATEDLLNRHLKIRQVDKETYERLKMGKPVYKQTLKS